MPTFENTLTKRPSWATCIASGFFVAGFGAFLLAIGFLVGPVMLGIGAALIAVGAMIGFFGGYGYFISYRPKL